MNYHSSRTGLVDVHQQEWFAPRLALTGDTEMLRLHLSASAYANASYKVPLTNNPYDGDSVRVTLLHEAACLGAIPAIEV